MPPKKSKPQTDRFGMKQTTLLKISSAALADGPPRQYTVTSALQDSPKRRRRRRSNVIEYDSSSDGIRAVKLESKRSIMDTSEEDAVPSPRKLVKKFKTRVDSESEGGAKVPSGPSSSKRRIDSGDEDNSKVEIPTATRRLLKRRKVHPPIDSDSDCDENLGDEVDKEKIIETRLRDRGKKSAFQENLEKLKRRKKGQSTSEYQERDHDFEDDDDTERFKPFKGAKSDNDLDSLFDGEESEEESDQSNDFIVEDDPLSAPLLPAQFSMESYEDLSHQFKKIFQFFVHIAVQPSRKRHKFMEENLRDEDYFSIPLQITRRKIFGLRDSLVASSVWRPEFKKALERYPDFNVVALDFALPSCDACHLGRRMSTLCGRLSGKSYDRLGFENIQTNSDIEDEALPQNFHLGRFCARRTQVFHEFTHWELELFKVICGEIDQLQDSGGKGRKKFYSVAFIGGKNPPEDLTDADELCEWLDERQVIEVEWQKVNNMMESARHLEMATRRGETDN